MITLDLVHLFKTDPSSTLVPRKVMEWVLAREKEFPVNYQIIFSPYKNDEVKNKTIVYEMGFFSQGGPSPHESRDIRSVHFPLHDGVWFVRITGLKRDDGTLIPFADLDNPLDENAIGLGPSLRSKITGFQDLLDKNDPNLSVLHSTNEGHEKSFETTWGYKRTQPIEPKEEEMVSIRCDRNVNDEWEFRGTPYEFMEEKVKPLLN